MKGPSCTTVVGPFKKHRGPLRLDTAHTHTHTHTLHPLYCVTSIMFYGEERVDIPLTGLLSVPALSIKAGLHIVPQLITHQTPGQDWGLIDMGMKCQTARRAGRHTRLVWSTSVWCGCVCEWGQGPWGGASMLSLSDNLLCSVLGLHPGQ